MVSKALAVHRSSPRDNRSYLFFRQQPTRLLPLFDAMIDWIKNIFLHYKFIEDKLQAFGFLRQDEAFILRKTLQGSGFQLTVRVNGEEVTTEVTDPVSDELYTLYLYNAATGSFVGKIRNAVEETLLEIRRQCCIPHVFKSSQAQALIAFVREKYSDELEFLWERFPQYAVWRRKDTGKWYGVLLTVQSNKLGIAKEGKVEILDFRVPADHLRELLCREGFLPAYHMNKKHWCTAVLDGTVDTKILCELLDVSYQLAIK